MASAVSKNKVMEKTNQDHQQVQHLPLKCPRCDSSNTKFCYYNNYSLSQPRHFCKACKRYWTRGGTLRNVPVGGGCRKNKRLKRHPQPPSSNGGDGISTAASTATTSPSTIHRPQIDLSSSSNHITNPMFYSMPTNNYHLGINNFPFFSRFNSNRVSSDSNNEFDFQMSGSVGLGFVQNYDHEYKNGFNPVKQIVQDSSIISTSNDSILFGSSNFASTSSTMASLLPSSLQHQKFITNNGLKDHIVTATNNSFPGLMPVEDMQMPDGNGRIEKEVKNIGQNRLDWNPYPVDQIINSSDSSSLLWNSANVGSWFDPSNITSSVPIP